MVREFICEELASAAGLVTCCQSPGNRGVSRKCCFSWETPVEGSVAPVSDAKGVAQTNSVSCRRCLCCMWTSYICGNVLTCRVVVSKAT